LSRDLINVQQFFFLSDGNVGEQDEEITCILDTEGWVVENSPFTTFAFTKNMKPTFMKTRMMIMYVSYCGYKKVFFTFFYVFISIWCVLFMFLFDT